MTRRTYMGCEGCWATSIAVFAVRLILLLTWLPMWLTSPRFRHWMQGNFPEFQRRCRNMKRRLHWLYYAPMYPTDWTYKELIEATEEEIAAQCEEVEREEHPEWYK